MSQHANAKISLRSMLILPSNLCLGARIA